jgi:hypothetical protein
MNKAVAQRLLALADHPGQVRTVTYPQFGYEVPGELFAKFAELGPVADPGPQEPKTFTDGDTDRGALEKRDKARKARKAAAAKKAEEEKE